MKEKEKERLIEELEEFFKKYGIRDVMDVVSRLFRPKEYVSLGEQMDFPDTFDEFVKIYGFKDEQEVYSNGIELIPVFRVRQWLEKEGKGE